MGLDQYLGRFKKANINKTNFDFEESNELLRYNGKYRVFAKLPDCLKDIATEITIVREERDYEKLERDLAGGKKLYVSMMSGGNITFRCEDDRDFTLTLTYEQLDKYAMRVERTVHLVEGDFNAAYWRKANQIRLWFVDHLDDFGIDDNGGHYKVTEDVLWQLMQDCRNVLNCHDKADELLPTSSGFFFGTTDYDDRYFMTLEDTIKQLSEVMTYTDWENEVVVYTESW